MYHFAPPGYIINKSTIAVDYWNVSNSKVLITHFFLTHAHEEQTKGLDSSWNYSTIFCTKITRALLIDALSVGMEFLVALEIGVTHDFRVNETESFQVDVLNANHCPGSAMFLFRGSFGTVLATGDFRYDASMFVDTPLGSVTLIDVCYLDATYCSKQYELIPSKEEALFRLISYIECTISENVKVKFVVTLEKLGKEELVVGLACRFCCKVLVSEERLSRYADVLNLPNCFIDECHLTDEVFIEVRDHNCSSYFGSRYHSNEVRYITATVSNGQPTSFSVPYADHSSLSELEEFMAKLRPRSMISTLNDNSCIDLMLLASYLGNRQNKEVKKCAKKKQKTTAPEPRLVDIDVKMNDIKNTFSCMKFQEEKETISKFKLNKNKTLSLNGFMCALVDNVHRDIANFDTFIRELISLKI